MHAAQVSLWNQDSLAVSAIAPDCLHSCTLTDAFPARLRFAPMDALRLA